MATPIGNLADLSLRAVQTLVLADAVACEDTRHSAALMRHLGIDKPLFALHQHNEQQASETVLQRLGRGERVACISDAGTPAISDPGAVVVAAAQAAGFPTVAVPGASSAVAAVSVAGDTSGRGFQFTGFLPARGSEREAALRALAANDLAQVLFEAPHRIEALATQLAQACPGRRVTVCRELTKQFETTTTLTAAELPAWLAGDPNRLRGEFVVVVHGQAPSATAASAAHEHTLRTLLRDLPLKQAVGLAAELTGAPRNALYEQALAWKQQG